MTNLPDRPEPATAIDVEPLRRALLDTAAAPVDRLAVTLLTDIPGDIYAQPEFRRYLIVSDLGGVSVAAASTYDDQAVAVDWRLLALELIEGALQHLPTAHRELVRIAASIGAEDAFRIPLGASVAALDPDALKVLIGAFTHAVEFWAGDQPQPEPHYADGEW